MLPDSPADARWLTAAERQWLADRVAAEHAQADGAVHSHFGQALREPRLWQLAALYFVIVVSLYSVSFWLPQILQALSGAGAVRVGTGVGGSLSGGQHRHGRRRNQLGSDAGTAMAHCAVGDRRRRSGSRQQE